MGVYTLHGGEFMGRGVGRPDDGVWKVGRVRCPLLHFFGFVCSLDDGIGRVDVVSGRLGICCS